MTPIAKRIAAEMKGRAALVVGRAGMDLYPDADGAAIEQAGGFVADLGGSAGGISAAIAKMGCPSALLSAVSDDAVGAFVLDRLRRVGVDTSYCAVAGPPRRTSLALAEIKPAPQVVIYRNEAADLAIAESDADRVDLGAVGVVIVTGTALSRQPSRGAVGRLVGRARAAGRPLVLDIDYRASAWGRENKPAEDEARRVLSAAARRFDMVVGNDEEFDVLGRRGRGRDFAEGLRDDGIDVLYKMGAGGCDILSGEGGGACHIGVFAVTTVKPFGAGDAFLGTIIAKLAAGGTMTDAVRSGAAAAALTVSRRGGVSAMPDKAELEKFILAAPQSV